MFSTGPALNADAPWDVCDHRHHRIFCLDGPTHLVCKLNHCPDPRCPGHHKTVSPEAEATITVPSWVLGWDVFCWIGHRRFARHWSVPQIRGELLDTYKIPLASDAIEKDIGRYQTMLAARQQDPERLRLGVTPDAKISSTSTFSSLRLDSASCCEAARSQPAKPVPPSHHAYTRLLTRLDPDPSVLFCEVEPLLKKDDGVLVLDDSTLDHFYAKKIEPVQRHWSGKHKRVVWGTIS